MDGVRAVDGRRLVTEWDDGVGGRWLAAFERGDTRCG